MVKKHSNYVLTTNSVSVTEMQELGFTDLAKAICANCKVEIPNRPLYVIPFQSNRKVYELIRVCESCFDRVNELHEKKLEEIRINRKPKLIRELDSPTGFSEIDKKIDEKIDDELTSEYPPEFSIRTPPEIVRESVPSPYDFPSDSDSTPKQSPEFVRQTPEYRHNKKRRLLSPEPEETPEDSEKSSPPPSLNGPQFLTQMGDKIFVIINDRLISYDLVG